jgi:hypothetical protein
MKRILFLLLLTVSVYGQNPSRFTKIQITGNSNSGTATKVNVQEANGEVNTQTINTGFNKNIGLNSGDVVGADNLLNQYSTVPSNWVAQNYTLGSVVFYGGKQWIAKIATVAGDVPNSSSKWEEITFESLANKTVTVDQTIIGGSTNAVSGNAVFDGLATKFPTPTGLTTNYLPKWSGSGFVNSKIFDNNVGISFGGSTFFGGYEFLTPAFGNNTIYIGTPDGTQNPRVYISHKTVSNQPQKVVLGSAFSAGQATASWYLENGRFVVGSLYDNGEDKLQVNGTITASPAVSPNQVVVKSQLDAVGRPYKVYTALLSQSGTNAPIATVLENTLGGTVVWSRNSNGVYFGTLSGAFTVDKTGIMATPSFSNIIVSAIRSDNNSIIIRTSTSGTLSDSGLTNVLTEIRVYN